MSDSGDRHSRPSPDALLAQVSKQERSGEGKLKIFLGAAPGVGKTFTMLEAARVQAMEGVKVVIGIAETHGRTETAELLLGLDIVPRRTVEYKGSTLQEMDLDKILEIHPTLVIVDELAHTNAPGSRHPKRYLDVEELLSAGIDVYSTVNIQHLETLNDAVAQITGIVVRETVPDRIIERADEVELVDISVEELLERLRRGKVYVPDQAARAIRSYFRTGNLTALRQLALRHLADRVDRSMQTYMQAHAIPGPWPVTERLLVSVGPSPLSPRLVRATRRMAERRHAEWFGVYVETPRHHRLSQQDHARLAATMELVEEMGGELITVPGSNIAEELIRVAQERNITEVVIGRSNQPWWSTLLRGSIVHDLIKMSGKIDIYVITGDEEHVSAEPPPLAQPEWQIDQYIWSTVIVACAAGICKFLQLQLGLPNLSLIFLLGVLLVAARWGLRPSIYASLLSVLIYDFFLVPPFHTFTISNPQDVLALITFIIVAVITSNLTGRVRDQGEAARRRELRTAALYDLSREIASASGLENVLTAVVRQVAQILSAQVIVLLPDDNRLDQCAAQPLDILLSDRERGAATWAWEHNDAAGRGTGTLPGEPWLYLPLRTSYGAIGVIALKFESGADRADLDHRRLVDSLAHQSAVAIESARFALESEQTKLLGESERLQTILLSSISHDLRTPLASILGSATTLRDRNTHYSEETRHELLTTIQEEAERLNRFVENLLDTTRLESGQLTLNRDWIDVSDLLGTAVEQTSRQLQQHSLEWAIQPNLPMLYLDFVLITQAFINLLDNSAKYSPAGTTITISAQRENESIVISIADMGIGIPPEDLERIFDRFYRVELGDRQRAGTGLGLSICRGILEEHGGSVKASSLGPNGRGSIVSVKLPIGDPPPVMEPVEQPL